MNYQNSLHTSRPVFGYGFKQRTGRRRSFDVPGGWTLWLTAAKITVGIVAIALLFNFWLGHSIARVEQNLAGIHERQLQLKDEQMALLAERASLMSEKQIQRRAGMKLALFAPEQDQIVKLH